MNTLLKNEKPVRDESVPTLKQAGKLMEAFLNGLKPDKAIQLGRILEGQRLGVLVTAPTDGIHAEVTFVAVSNAHGGVTTLLTLKLPKGSVH